MVKGVINELHSIIIVKLISSLPEANALKFDDIVNIYYNISCNGIEFKSTIGIYMLIIQTEVNNFYICLKMGDRNEKIIVNSIKITKIR